MPCDYFTIDNKGKITIKEREKSGNLKVKKLDNLKVLEVLDKKYFLNKKAIMNLKNYTEQNLKENPIYSVIGWYVGRKDQGITGQVTDLDILNAIVREVKKY